MCLPCLPDDVHYVGNNALLFTSLLYLHEKDRVLLMLNMYWFLEF